MPRALARLERFLLGARARRRGLAAGHPLPSRSFASASASASASPSPATAADLTASGARGVLRLRGKGALQFLQGMVTNDMRPLMGATPSQSVAYAALLTPKGKLIEDVFVHRCSPGGGEESAAEPGDDDEETLLLDVGAASKREALAWLARYRLRRPLALDDVSSDLHAWAAWGAEGQTSGAPPAPAAAAAATTTGWRADPRLSGGLLGWRGIFEASESSDSAEAAAAAAGHRRLRYALAVPEGAAEMLSAATAAAGGGSEAASATAAQRAPNPLEFGLDALGGVSYDKGCYIGQERNSFTHYRGVLRRRTLPVRLTGGSTASSLAGSPIVDPSDGRPVGTLMAVEGDLGLAHLLLARALPGGDAADPAPSFAVGAGSEAASAVPLGRPAWWPREWGREEAAAAASGGGGAAQEQQQQRG